MTTQTDLSKRSLLNTDVPTLENFYTRKLPYQHGRMQVPTRLKYDGSIDVTRRYAPDDTPGLQNVIGLGRLPNGFGDYSNGLIMIYTTTELGGETIGLKSQVYGGEGVVGPNTYQDQGFTEFPGNIESTAIANGVWTLPRIYVRAAVHKPTPIADYATGWKTISDFRYRMILNPETFQFENNITANLLYNNINLHPGVGLFPFNFTTNPGIDNYCEWMPQASISTQTIGSEVYVYLSTGYQDHDKFNTQNSGVSEFPQFVWKDYPQNSTNHMRGSYVLKISKDLSVTEGYVPYTGISSIFADNSKNANIWLIGPPVNGAFQYLNFRFNEITNIDSNTMQTANFTSFGGGGGGTTYTFTVEGTGPVFGKSGLVPVAPSQFIASDLTHEFPRHGFATPEGASTTVKIAKYGAGIGCLVHPWSAGDYGPPEVWTFQISNSKRDTFTIWRHKWDAGNWLSYRKATQYIGAIDASVQEAHGSVTPNPPYGNIVDFNIPLTATYHDDSKYQTGKSSHPKYNPKGYGFAKNPYLNPANIVGTVGPIPAKREYEAVFGIVVDTTNVTFKVVRDSFHRGVLHLIAMDLWASGGSYNPFTDLGYSPQHSLVLSNALWYSRSSDDGHTWSPPRKTNQLTGARNETFKSYRTRGFVANGAQTQVSDGFGRYRPISMAQNSMMVTYDNIPLVGCVDYWNYYDASNNKAPFFKKGLEHAGAHLSLYAFTENIGLSGANANRSDIVFKKPTAI